MGRLEEILKVKVEEPVERLAPRIARRLGEVLAAYDELSREEKLVVGRCIPLIYPDLSTAPQEVQELEYVGAYSEGLVVKGGAYGSWALYKARRPVVLGGHFGYGALGESEDALVLGGVFGSSAFWRARNPTVIGCRIGDDAFIRAEGVKCFVDTIGSIAETVSGVIVARRIGSVTGTSPDSVVIYCVEVGPGGESCIKVSEEDLKVKVTPENIDEVLARLRSKYGP